MNKWMDEQMDEWMNEWMTDWLREGTAEMILKDWAVFTGILTQKRMIYELWRSFGVTV